MQKLARIEAGTEKSMMVPGSGCNPAITECTTLRGASAYADSRRGTMRAMACENNVAFKPLASGSTSRLPICAVTAAQRGDYNICCCRGGRKKRQDHVASPPTGLVLPVSSSVHSQMDFCVAVSYRGLGNPHDSLLIIPSEKWPKRTESDCLDAALVSLIMSD